MVAVFEIMNVMEDPTNSRPDSNAHNIQIPQIGGKIRTIPMSAGDILFMLGANGAGKSSLMQRIYSQHQKKAHWISALRQTFFVRDFQMLRPQERDSVERDIRDRGVKPESRWTDRDAGSKPNIAITNLINMTQMQSRRIADFVYRGNSNDASQYAHNHKQPLEIMGHLLQQSNLPITLELDDNEKILAHKKGSEPYSIAQLSDGERNVILIASEVLAAQPGTMVLIDEPERHLHRSIISPLLKALFAMRSDCAFVVSTHEATLPIDNPDSKTLLVRDCTYIERITKKSEISLEKLGEAVSQINAAKKTVKGWDTDLMESGNEIDKEVMRDILGARRRLLFVEGAEESLDKSLYSLIFPDVSVIPKQDSKSVEHAVMSIRDLEQLHWVVAYGIIDRDARTQDDVEQLKEHRIYSLDVHSVESIYYDPQVRKAVGERMAKVVGVDAITLLEEAENAALEAIKGSARHLSEQKAEHKLRQEIFDHLPNRKKNALNEPICIRLDVPAILESESERLRRAIKSRDLDSIIACYPVRESPALVRLAKGLGFQGRREYEHAVLELLRDEPQLLVHVKGLLGTLSTDIEEHR